MSIRIVPQEQLEQNEKSMPEGNIPPLLFANLKSLYSSRAERLRQLAEDHPLGDYLTFAAGVVEAQQKVLHDHPLKLDLSDVLKKSGERPPLDIAVFPRDAHWHTLLRALIEELKPDASGQVLSTLENLEKASEQELEEQATALLQHEFRAESNDKAPFIWAALSLFWAQMASQLPGKARAVPGEHRQFCPVCGSIPVSGVVQLGTSSGLRYLHCNLCESEWHMVRVKCSNCEESSELNYWSLDSENSAIKAESCGHCGTYLKLLYQEKDHRVEAVADDLASLVLDVKMEEEGFSRSSINPFLFPESSIE
ncbi:formate dehydrogenase accessory protein FdhE [Pectobacterium brasiliense]|uniref:formate dehydrogenase accessory protein FdhE n=1 Tax=Pectobacterium brasiliense TaxID=180957 RepID=UPI0019691B97|nr:formate dehydrogenase accessory protein FdhE [Pectobacterium brasiliense]MBN3096471.1 formate dehydrogenase accessory protein FdhE [Pectobacterium brasiliense]MBN3101430.1 formate dehydrogenase accessory protein FdhE [Pectobacterium brasiliense]MBN3114892.1 formate dehydrogenase accessory protein FdhE [Pectobacterium brasiliense]MBN3166010.1 formate dehydrogenase accessory protein FdhE [Pectobacterium brasiliense]